MQPNRYNSYKYGKQKNEGSSFGFWALILLIICAAAAWFLYQDKIVAFFKGLPTISQVIGETKNPRIGPPGITVHLNGEDTVIPQENSASSGTEATPITKLSFGRGSVLRFIFPDEPKLFTLKVYKDEALILTSNELSLTESELQGDGEYDCIAEVDADGKSQSVKKYPFAITADFPAELSISSTEIQPGELLVICASNINANETLDVQSDFEFKPNSFSYGNKRVALLPVSYTTEAEKVYQVKVGMGGENYSYAIRVDKKVFITQHLEIDEKVAAATRNEQSAQEITDKISPLKPISDPEPYWTGKFILPVENGRVTETDFGKRRYVNGSATSYRHNGLDIGQDKGTPVMASNNGRVLLADFLTETGNTVIIEHGFGLKTWYYHMDELNVKKGDMVKTGDVIGKVGSTGFSTSPHLHFSASINQIYINPITLINQGVPLLTQEK